MTMPVGPCYPSWKAMDRPEDLYMPGYDHHHQPMQMNSPPWQPMDRFMHEQERPMFRPGPPQDHIMHPYPDVLRHRMSICVGSEGSMDSPQQRYASPSYSGHSISHTSSTISERDLSPGPSPFIRHASFPPELCVERFFPGFDPYRSIEHMSGYPGGHCVALHDVQQYADAQPEPVVCEEESTTYGSYAQEGYQPMQLATPVSVATPSSQCYLVEEDCKPVQEPAPVYRHRRAKSSASPTSPVVSSRVTKRPSANRRRSPHSNGRTKNVNHDDATLRPFPCPFATYGCPSTFGSKNEWKRHVTTQHLRLGFWRCDQCPNGERKPNDFNRKDLFIQHVRRMHPVSADIKRAVSKPRSPRRGSRGSNKSDATEEELLADIERRCYRQTRTAPELSGCMFCDKTFTAWEERMEHVGRHMDTANNNGGTVTDPADWKADDVTEDWLVKEKLVKDHQGRLVLA